MSNFNVILMMKTELERFIGAHQESFTTALAEIKSSKKQSHWMWYIFPQLKGLGLSETAKFYGIANQEEARNFLAHPVLGKNLAEISNALLMLTSDDAHQIFGSPDHMKLKSSMTLFASLPNANPIFEQVLNKFFDGERDEKTLKLINS
jgi:uncharacterized protein (DUF1810 family)